MSTDSNTLPLCANCGKGEESSGELKSCTACKIVKYCSRDCQKAHRSRHKKECRKRAAEIHDEILFKQPPPEDCPICFLPIPSLRTGKRYKSCCGKFICSGCIYTIVTMSRRESICPFCRALTPTSDEEEIETTRKRVEVDDAQAIYELGCFYAEGRNGLPQDRGKALELWHQSAKLGNASAYYNIGYAHLYGRGVERDETKAINYWELAAIGGDVKARHNLGCSHGNAGNYGGALKHFMIAIGSGDNGSLTNIKQLYLQGCATREDYAKALKTYQAYLKEIKSDDRDKAAEYDEVYKYYE